VRVEWSKAKLRRDRWVEEVATLREEMKRVLRILRTMSEDWKMKATLQADAEPGEGVHYVRDRGLAAGLKAYAARQADLLQRIFASFHARWSVSMASAL
ncbi:hypothetical protein DFH09DRAFT_830201, partial [Mycena vulgaris]